MNFIEKIQSIQMELKAPKNMKNTFGNYSYRNVDGILEAVKPLLNKHKLMLTMSDNVIEVGERVYIKATATITDGENSVSVDGFAREDVAKKGMDLAQLTGSCSSYARKYALNGLLCIDDSKDFDSMDNTQKEEPKRRRRTPQPVNIKVDETVPF